MKHVVLILVSLLVSACGGSGGGASAPAAAPGVPDAPAPAPVSKSITLQRGSGYECFAYGVSLFCRGSATNPDLHINSVSYTERARATNGITALRTWDDSLCFETTVSAAPYSRAAGPATYCFGEASLNVRAEAIVYSPAYAHAAHGTASVSYTHAPMAGADMTLVAFSGMTAFGDYIITDGTGAVSTETVTCSLSGSSLVCPSFTAQVQ